MSVLRIVSPSICFFGEVKTLLISDDNYLILNNSTTDILHTDTVNGSKINKMNELRVLQSNEKQIIVTYWNVQNGHIQFNIASIFMTERATNIRRSDLSCKIIEHSQFQHSNLQILFYFHVQHQNVKINFKIIVII